MPVPARYRRGKLAHDSLVFSFRSRGTIEIAPSIGAMRPPRSRWPTGGGTHPPGVCRPQASWRQSSHHGSVRVTRPADAERTSYQRRDETTLMAYGPRHERSRLEAPARKACRRSRRNAVASRDGPVHGRRPAGFDTGALRPAQHEVGRIQDFAQVRRRGWVTDRPALGCASPARSRARSRPAHYSACRAQSRA